MGFFKVWGILAIVVGVLAVVRLVLTLVFLFLPNPVSLAPLDAVILTLGVIVFFPIAIIYYAAKDWS